MTPVPDSAAGAQLKETVVTGAVAVVVGPWEREFLTAVGRHTKPVEIRMRELAEGDSLVDHLETIMRHLNGALAVAHKVALSAGVKVPHLRAPGVVASACTCGSVHRSRR